VLELAVLGLLHEGSRHGYELRKDLAYGLGRPRAVSYGSLYPTLRCLLERGLTRLEPPPAQGGRARVVYALTASGRRHFQAQICQPAAVEDDEFEVHFAFFARAEAGARVRILEARRVRLLQQREQLSGAAHPATADRYRRELHRRGLESVEQELRWVNRQLELEGRTPRPSTSSRSN
jgi:DNA-binding PadR family transcriptional regulator